MLATFKKDQKIINVYNILRNKIHKYGKNISLPKNTDPQKTYGWRYLSGFVDRMEELELNDDCIPTVIDALLIHAKNHRLLNRGFAVLNKLDILDLIIKNIEKENKSDKSIINTVMNSFQFVKSKVEIDIISTLLNRRRPDLYANMTLWMQQNHININYVAISKSCRKALGMIKGSERELYPPIIKLMKIRIAILSNKENLELLKNVLGNDLFEG